MLLIVMYQSQTWRVRPGEPFTFGRAPACSVMLPAADRGVSRTAGSFRHHDGSWWLHNDSTSSVLGVLGDRGFRVDLPPGMAVPLQQWHAKVTLGGALNHYTLRLRLPDLDDAPDPAAGAPVTDRAGQRSGWFWRPGSRTTSPGGTPETRRLPAQRTPQSGSAGSPTRWPSGARTSGTATCASAFRGCAGRGHWRNSRCCLSPPANSPPRTCAACPRRPRPADRHGSAGEFC